MGNWRRVHIVGTCDAVDVPKLRKALTPNDDLTNWHCLLCGGLCGLPNWASENINAIGNLAERDYTPQSVADQLLKLLSVAPSLKVKVHCGDDYEADNCINTVTASLAPVVTVGDPEVSVIGEISMAQIDASMRDQLSQRRPR